MSIYSIVFRAQAKDLRKCYLHKCVLQTYAYAFDVLAWKILCRHLSVYLTVIVYRSTATICRSFTYRRRLWSLCTHARRSFQLLYNKSFDWLQILPGEKTHTNIIHRSMQKQLVSPWCHSSIHSTNLMPIFNCLLERREEEKRTK